MADTYKCVGQANPAANTNANLYTVPASTGFIASSLIICNQDAVERTVYVNVSHGAPSNSQPEYLLWAEPMPPNSFKIITAGICLTAADRVGVFSDSANMSFSLFGVEQSPIPAASPKLLGAAQPNAVTLTDLYTVPVGKSAICSSLWVTLGNAGTLDPDPARFRVAVSVGGGAIAAKDYIAYDAPMGGGPPSGNGPGVEGTVLLPVAGLCLQAGDKVRVYGTDRTTNTGITNFCFHLFGVEL